MRRTNILRLLMTAALLVLAIPIGASAQNYRDRYYNRDDRDQYNRVDRREVRNAMFRLENSSVRLENDLNYTPGRRVFGIFQFRTIDTNAIAEVREFRRAVRQLRNSSYDGRDINGSRDEARVVLDRGVRLDRYLRLRTGSGNVDYDLSDIRSSLHIIADAYGLSMGY